MTSGSTKGFTLLELLVVIAVIGILAAVIVGSIGTSRKKGAEAALRREALQMRNLMELEFNTSGSYANLYTDGWIPYSTTYNCANTFAGTYAADAKNICDAIVSIGQGKGDPGWGAGIRFMVQPVCYADPNPPHGCISSIPNSWSILVWLPNKQVFLCLGSNGQNSETTTSGNGVGAVWQAPGCPGPYAGTW